MASPRSSLSADRLNTRLKARQRRVVLTAVAAHAVTRARLRSETQCERGEPCTFRKKEKEGTRIMDASAALPSSSAAQGGQDAALHAAVAAALGAHPEPDLLTTPPPPGITTAGGSAGGETDVTTFSLGPASGIWAPHNTPGSGTVTIQRHPMPKTKPRPKTQLHRLDISNVSSAFEASVQHTVENTPPLNDDILAGVQAFLEPCETSRADQTPRSGGTPLRRKWQLSKA